MEEDTGRGRVINRVYSNVYRIEVPLPQNPLRATNSYVIKGQDRNLIIDTGFNLPECMNAMRSGLNELDVSLRETDFFITHMHSDHLDLLWALPTASSTIYLSKPDAETVRSSDKWVEVRRYFSRISGFPEDVFQEVIEKYSPHRHRRGDPPKFTTVKEGDKIGVNEFVFECVETPGHSEGHMCLYESKRKILFSGDHILNDISPNISLWQYDWNPLKSYLESLDKMCKFDVELVLPGHRSFFKDCKKRIEELKSHHQIRIKEISSILGNEGKDAFNIASEMSWDMTYESWDLFPPPQKLFATTEALSHLKYLEDKGLILRQMDGQRMLFSLK